MIEFTYGFELEGSFLGSLPMLIAGEWKGDESVRVGYPADIHSSGHHEFESPVYNDFASMITTLDQFKSQFIRAEYGATGDTNQPGANHYWNYSCGLHLNIALAGDAAANKLFSLVTNFKFIERLQQEALNFCEHQKIRLENHNYYCQRYQTKDNLKNGARSGDKYRFVRFHPEKRLEFRFLSPCEHKVENVTKTIQIIEEYLNSNFELVIDVQPKDTKPVIHQRVKTQLERIL